MTPKRMMEDNTDISKIQKLKIDLDENQNNPFINKLINNRCIETFLGPFMSHLDLCILRMTCKRLSKLQQKKALRKKQFQIGSLCIRNGYFILFSWIYENIFPQFNSSENLATFAYSKRDEKEQIKLIENFKHPSEVLKESQITGNLNILEWASKKVNRSEMSYDTALLHGHLHILKWFREKNYIIPEERHLYVTSLSRGYEDIFEWAKEIYPNPKHPDIVRQLASHGKIEFLNQIKGEVIDLGFNGSNWKINLCVYYATIGDLESLISFSSSMELTFPVDLIGEVAAKHGHLNILEWIIQNHPYKNYFWGRILIPATSAGQSKTLEWAFKNPKFRKIENGWYYNTFYKQECYINAAKNGHWDIVKWFQSLWKINYPLMDFMAKDGDLQLFKWAKENRSLGEFNPKLDSELGFLNILMEEGHFEVIKWLCEFGYTFSLLGAVTHSQFEILKWLKNNNEKEKCIKDWNETLFLKALEIGNSRIISWLLEEKCPGFRKYKKLLK